MPSLNQFYEVIKRNKKYEDESSSNFDGEPVIDSMNLEQSYIDGIV